MHDILWAQTEPDSSVLVNGIAKDIDIVDYVFVVENPDYKLIKDNQIKVFYNKKKKGIVVQGHVINLDSIGRKIAFAFFAREKNIFYVMTLLKQRLTSIGLTPPSDTIDRFLHLYANQNFVSFLTKRKIASVICVIFSLISLLFCKWNDMLLMIKRFITNNLKKENKNERI